MVNMQFTLGKQVKIYVFVILLQFGFAGFAIVAKSALNKGTSHYVFSVYRNAIAAVVFAPFAFVLERNTRPKITFQIVLKVFILGLLDPIMGQNLFYAGMKYTTATFTTAMCNVLPALTFLMAWILRVEKVNLKKLHSQAKIMGTLVTVVGAMIMTLVRGSDIGLPWTKHEHSNSHAASGSTGNQESPIKGALMIGAANIGYSLFYILQAIILNSYPAGLSLVTMICAFGALQGAALTLAVEKGNNAIWSIGWDAKLLAYVYGGLVSSGITYYVSGLVMKEKGPVFVTSFNPLNMVIVAVLSSFIFSEQLDVGKVTGSLVIIVGLYLVIWGKSNDMSKSPHVAPVDEKHASTTNSSEKAAKTNGGDVTDQKFDSTVV